MFRPRNLWGLIMAATSNPAISGTWTEIAAAGGVEKDVLVSLIDGRACEVFLKDTQPETTEIGHPMVRGGENGEFAATLKGTEKLWARSRTGDVTLAVTK